MLKIGLYFQKFSQRKAPEPSIFTLIIPQITLLGPYCDLSVMVAVMSMYGSGQHSQMTTWRSETESNSSHSPLSYRTMNSTNAKDLEVRTYYGRYVIQYLKEWRKCSVIEMLFNLITISKSVSEQHRKQISLPHRLDKTRTHTHITSFQEHEMAMIWSSMITSYRMPK